MDTRVQVREGATFEMSGSTQKVRFSQAEVRTRARVWAYTRVATPVVTVTAEELEAAKRRRMIHRSKQCGMLEVDLVLGSWAAENVPKLSAEALDEYDKILQEETLDIFNMIARRSEIPSHLKDLSVMQSIMEYSWSNKSISLP